MSILPLQVILDQSGSLIGNLFSALHEQEARL